MVDPTKRFSERVDNYIKYRPKYPEDAINFIIQSFNINNLSVVADIGSGTGILTKPFLKRGIRCIGVEPNLEMRSAAERILTYAKFQSIDGRAEDTGLPNSSIDLILAGQAFHWFDIKKTKIEFRRILRSSGGVVLIWNDRLINTPFLKAYEDFIRRHSTDYLKVYHINTTSDDIVLEFLGSNAKMRIFKNKQVFDLDGILGRYASSSYSYIPGTKAYEQAEAELSAIFNEFQIDNSISVNYDCKVYYSNWNN